MSKNTITRIYSGLILILPKQQGKWSVHNANLVIAFGFDIAKSVSIAFKRPTARKRDSREFRDIGKI